MEYNSGVSMILPDSIGLIGNDFDDEDHDDIVHEQTNQNEVKKIKERLFFEQHFFLYLLDCGINYGSF